ncbi:unnamed protein product [Gadus morhua 'NCC']
MEEEVLTEEEEVVSYYRLLALLPRQKAHGWSHELEVLVAMYWLACGASYRVTADAFGMPFSTVCRKVHGVVKEMMAILQKVCPQGGKIVTFLEGMQLSTQKVMYAETVSACSLMLVEEDVRIFECIGRGEQYAAVVSRA